MVNDCLIPTLFIIGALFFMLAIGKIVQIHKRKPKIGETSEFGMGLCYCLGLFLAHQYHRLGGEEEKMTELIGEERVIEMWFNGAADHLYDFRADQAPTLELRDRCAEFQNKCLGWRLVLGDTAPPTKEDRIWAIEEAKTLLMLIDKENGVTTIVAEWS